MNNSNIVGALFITLVAVLIIGSNAYKLSVVAFQKDFGNDITSIGGIGGNGVNATSSFAESTSSALGGAGGAGGIAECTTTGETIMGGNGEPPAGSNGGNGGNGASVTC